jgi:hypothetical protein
MEKKILVLFFLMVKFRIYSKKDFPRRLEMTNRRPCHLE